MLLITHDLGVVSQTCDKVAVMYAGEVVEYGRAEDIFLGEKHHPYTEGLFGSLPELNATAKRLSPINGFDAGPDGAARGLQVPTPAARTAPSAAKRRFPLPM